MARRIKIGINGTRRTTLHESGRQLREWPFRAGDQWRVEPTSHWDRPRAKPHRLRRLDKVGDPDARSRNHGLPWPVMVGEDDLGVIGEERFDLSGRRLHGGHRARFIPHRGEEEPAPRSRQLGEGLDREGPSGVQGNEFTEAVASEECRLDFE